MMQSIQESKKLANEVLKVYPDMDKEDRVYYKMEMAKVHAVHGLAYALLAVAEAVRKDDPG